jgi:hypothetical protein
VDPPRERAHRQRDPARLDLGDRAACAREVGVGEGVRGSGWGWQCGSGSGWVWQCGSGWVAVWQCGSVAVAG